MNANTIMAANSKGVVRARYTSRNQWDTELTLKTSDGCCLAADPQNPEIAYVGTHGQGVFRSTDAGTSWELCGLLDRVVKSLAISPHDSSTIYAGTKPAYIYRSKDDGRSWDELTGFRHVPGRWWWFSPAEKPFQAYVQAIALSPRDPDVILAGIEFGAVVRSGDAGTTWSGHRKGALRDCHALIFHNNSGDWVYEAGGTGGGVSSSQDGGLSWRKHKQGLAKNYGVSCAADPSEPKIWYAAVAPGPDKAYGNDAEAYLYRMTADDGWQPIGWEPHPMEHMPIALSTVPNQSGHLYAGLTNGDVWFTPDYGNNWEKLNFNFGSIQRTMIVITSQ